MEVNVAIAAQVTAYGRVLIRNLINRIDKAGGIVAYSATDSVYTNLSLEDIPEFKSLVGKEMGQFKRERSFRSGYFARTGLYALEGCSGNKPTVIKHTSYNRPDIDFQDVKHLALYGKVIKRIKAQWSQAIVTDKLGVRGAFSWIERKVNMSNTVGKAFPIEYGVLELE
jgi:DNA polymerase elongation subunit (family B)